MLNNEYDSIQIARVLQHSFEPLSAAEVKGQLERSELDFSFHPHASSVTDIQSLLESMPARRVEKLVSPGGENKYRWVFQSLAHCSSLVALFK